MQCAWLQVERWLAKQKMRLLACEHYHVIFTMPHALNALWLANVEVMSRLLFASVHDTLVELLGDAKYLGGKPGIIAAMHTWSQTLILHPHIHCLVSGGGLSEAGHWVACHGRVRSLQRRIVQAVRTGAWRKGKRLSSRLGHSLAARAFAVRRVTEQTGKQTPGVDGERWTTPEKKTHAGAPIGRWRGSRPAPLPRISSPKKNGQQRPLSIPTVTDRARPAVSLQALQPIAETTADHDAYGFRPTGRCADAIDPWVKSLRQQSSATWLLEGDMPGFFDNRSFTWVETHSPLHTRLVSKWLRSGCMDRGALFPTTAGVPPGGLSSPVISTRVLDGLEAGVPGGHWHRRVHHSNSGRWADACIVTANAREGLEGV